MDEIIADEISQNFKDITEEKFKAPLFQNKTKKSSRHKQINKAKDPETRTELTQQDIDPEQRTLIEIINDKHSGIPMSTATKSTLDNIKLGGKNKSSNKSERTLSAYGSSNSKYNKEKASYLLRNKVTIDNDAYTQMFKPKIVLDAMGRIKIEKPDIVEATKKINEEINKNTIPLVEYDSEKKITSMSFRDGCYVKKWTKEETELFYKGLECFGTDFSFLEILLRPRTRSEIKSKFRKEEKENPAVIANILKFKKPDSLMKMLSITKKIQEINQRETDTKYKRNRTKSNAEEQDYKDEVEFKKILKEDKFLNEKEESTLKDLLRKISNEDESERTISVKREEEEKSKEQEDEDEEEEDEGEDEEGEDEEDENLKAANTRKKSKKEEMNKPMPTMPIILEEDNNDKDNLALNILKNFEQ